jgi:hypothetical protein
MRRRVALLLIASALSCRRRATIQPAEQDAQRETPALFPQMPEMAEDLKPGDAAATVVHGAQSLKLSYASIYTERERVFVALFSDYRACTVGFDAEKVSMSIELMRWPSGKYFGEEYPGATEGLLFAQRVVLSTLWPPHLFVRLHGPIKMVPGEHVRGTFRLDGEGETGPVKGEGSFDAIVCEGVKDAATLPGKDIPTDGVKGTMEGVPFVAKSVTARIEKGRLERFVISGGDAAGCDDPLGKRPAIIMLYVPGQRPALTAAGRPQRVALTMMSAASSRIEAARGPGAGGWVDIPVADLAKVNELSVRLAATSGQGDVVPFSIAGTVRATVCR